MSSYAPISGLRSSTAIMRTFFAPGGAGGNGGSGGGGGGGGGGGAGDGLHPGQMPLVH